MSKEAMKLALEHAKRDERHINHAETRYWCRMYKDIAEKAVEALAKPDFWEGYVPEPVKPATEESSATQAQQALDKKAENARELGLDYEPAQQEPVAWVCYGSNNKHDIDFFEDEIADLAVGTKLYTHAQRTWVGLTDEEADELVQRFARYELLRAIEAKLRSKNEDRN